MVCAATLLTLYSHFTHSNYSQNIRRGSLIFLQCFSDASPMLLRRFSVSLLQSAAKMLGRTGELKRMVKDALDLNVKITALEEKRNRSHKNLLRRG